MANKAPVTVIISSTVGPGLTVTTLTMTDVVNLAFDYLANTIRIQRESVKGLQYFDYSAMATLTYTISDGTATITIS